MKPRRLEACLSDLALDEHLAGELEDASQAQSDEHLAGCARCRERRDAMAREHQAFLHEAPSFHAHAQRLATQAVRSAHVTAADVATDATRPARLPRVRLLSFATALAAAAAALLSWSAPGLEPPVLETRSKGAPSIGFFVSRDGQVRRGAQGQTVYPGDQLRFTYTADRALHLAVLDHDPRTASVFFPDGTHARRVDAASDVALDFSVELDAQLGPERIHGVFCTEAFEVEPLRAALAGGRALPIAAGCTVSVIELHKVPAR